MVTKKVMTQRILIIMKQYRKTAHFLHFFFDNMKNLCNFLNGAEVCVISAFFGTLAEVFQKYFLLLHFFQI